MGTFFSVIDCIKLNDIVYKMINGRVEGHIAYTLELGEFLLGGHCDILSLSLKPLP